MPVIESVTLMGQHDSQLCEKEPQVKVTTPIARRETVRLPFWLTKPALILFFSIFIACAVSLIALDRFMKAQHGLPLTISSSEYSWTYGPTALLVVILSLWRRIDYYYKSVQPWRELQSGPVPASRSVLLDYLSPLQLQSMYRAFRMGHYQVTATILSFFLLKVIILASTTLFVVQPAMHLEVVEIIYQDIFDASSAWKAPYNATYVASSRPIFNGGSDKYVWKYLARLNDAVANDSSWSVNDGLVTQRFHPSASSMNLTSLKAPVGVFVPKITCEEAIPIADLYQPYSTWIDYSWTSKTCSAGGNQRGYFCPDQKMGAINGTVCGNKPWTYTVHRVNCSRGISSAEETFSRNWTGDMGNYDIRYAITAAQYSIDMDVARENISLATKLIDSTAIICKIGYGIVSANATYDLLSGNVMIATEDLGGKGKLVRNLTSYSLAEMLWTDLDASADALVADKDVPVRTNKDLDDPLVWRVDEALFQLMAVQLGQRFKPGIFLEPGVLESTSITVMEGLLNEFARESLRVENRTRGTADGVVSEARLQTRTAVAWLIAAGFCVLGIICLLLLFLTSTSRWIPAFCGSIAGHAAILVNSPHLLSLLKDSGHSTEKVLVNKLCDTQFLAIKNSDGCFHIDMVGGSTLKRESATQKDGSNMKSWTPMTGSLAFVMLALASPVVAIGILELLQQLSDQRHGLLEMHNSDSTVVSYILRIASTGAVFGIATMFNSLEFTTATFAPYSALRAGSNRTDRTILFHLLSVSPFLVIYKSLRVGQIGSAASNLSSLLGSFLTIVVSGLWILTAPAIVERPSEVTVNNWQTSWLSSAPDDGGAAVVLNLVRYGGVNTSSGIWKDLVLPGVDFAASGTSRSGGPHQSSNYTYAVGALRPFLNCSLIPSRNFAFRVREETVPSGFRMQEATAYEKYISTHFLAPYDCGDVKSNGMANISFGLTVSGRESYISTTWVGQYLDLNTTAGASDADCPSVGILFGEAAGIGTQIWKLTALACSQGIEQIPVKVTYKGDLALRQINEDFPPAVERDKAWKWTNKTKSTALGYKLDRFLTADLAPFPEDKMEPNTDTDYDSFFNHLIYGPNGMDKEDLVGSSQAKALIRLVERDYTEYMRNVIDLNFRAYKDTSRNDLSSADSSSDKKPSSVTTKVTGTASENVTRLAIHSTSKLILQVLLATMAVLGLLSYLLVKIGGTLPRNPCSIASTMAFLAGSQLCDLDSGIIPRGAEYMTDGQLKEAFDGWVFSLGWWQKEEASVESEEPNDDASTLGDRDVPDEAQEGQRTPDRFGIDVGRTNVSKF
ncbi:hypothetical protein FOQG_14578 [Fusarium oxysporum f. sp. raphani 54005]|uniref:Uncharacterized protein n=2 Tax=Fusarium oxysporum f. sp. raphani TaxID=96318 RepID=X0BPX4_FUSOX|nr:hypothetical protein FOQG_14578 [Fusarium oxysporum f. sp. raphani 54005]KAG7425127.1 hypothetical protein Forpi1262_v014102 [Fusarium oxysporum f. sp. raphani]